MSYASVIDSDALIEYGILRLKNIRPHCPLCDREQPFEDRKFISLYGMCQPCDLVHRPAILRKEKR